MHNMTGCTSCHGGSGSADKEEAHEGVVRAPSDSRPAESCGNCHANVVDKLDTSLHATQGGYTTILEARGADFSNPVLQEAFGNHCAECHVSCGQCHVSRPAYAGGGLLKGHDFKKVVSITQTCLACHGGRVGPEYQGKNEGVQGSVHWLKGGMNCFECHNVSQYHGSGDEKSMRFDGVTSKGCLDCHPESAPGQGDVMQHNLHGDKLDCRVCHSAGAYKSCYNCHTALDDNGLPYRTTDDFQMTFKIGRNPLQSEDRPWEYVLLRHIPVTPELFEFYGEDLLPNFDALPTWKYAAVHNMQRITPQNQECSNCHGQADLFLTEDDVDPAQLEANRDVIVTEIPD